jgi:hypothetical protein
LGDRFFAKTLVADDSKGFMECQLSISMESCVP